MTGDLEVSRRAAVDAFLERNRQTLTTAGDRARLIFALDATGSRQATWTMACELQGEMFQEVAKIGLSAQLNGRHSDPFLQARTRSARYANGNQTATQYRPPTRAVTRDVVAPSTWASPLNSVRLG